MKFKDAIDIIKRLSDGLGNNGYVKLANNLAIDALEKQIPKSPTNDRCQACNEDVRNWTGEENFKYCCSCGQSIDWESEGE